MRGPRPDKARTARSISIRRFRPSEHLSPHALPARGPHECPLHPSPHKDPVPRVSDDAAMLSVSRVPIGDPRSPEVRRAFSARSRSTASRARGRPAARVLDERATELSAPPHYPWYAAAARRRRCRSGCQQLTAVKSCLLLLLRSILDLLHYSCKSKLWAKTANHDHWRCRMLVSQAKIELQLSNMIQAQQSKKIIKLYSFRSKL